MGGPTTDYAINPYRERADGAVVSGDSASYTFTNPIPANATGTWAFSIEARRDVTLEYPPPEGGTVREAAFNVVHYQAVTGTLEPRRGVVQAANCNTCHDRLAFHGGQRLNPEECIICHNPNANDSDERPPDQNPPESIDFKRMIHRIHRSEDLTRDFTVYGNNGSVHNYNHLRFPGDLRDCTSCHISGTWNIPDNAPAGRLDTPTPRDWYTPQKPTAAACLGCHDSQSAAAHAFVMTAPFGEACAACHGVNAEFSVDKSHAR
jgi:OmcA/MtrC family decaheme c-type cytochrome